MYPLNSIERFDATRQQWVDAGNFPEIKDAADAAVVGEKVYVVSGKTLSSYSNKVYAADLLPHRDLYFRSVTGQPLNRAPSSLFAVGDLNISENQPIGTIVGDFNATDPDGDQIFYSLVDGDTGSISFTIDTNGTLRTAMEFDHEMMTSISVVVRTTDEHNASIEQQFTVLITNLNEAPNDGGSASLVLPESSDSQTFSSGWTPVDPDGDILSWSIAGGADAPMFFINAANGEITFASVDFENPVDVDGNNTYDVTIRVTDGGGLFAEQNIRVGVDDVYESSRENHTVQLNHLVDLEMIWVDPGSFTMGSPPSEYGRKVNEVEHNVTLIRGYYLGKYEVTQAQYQAVMSEYNGLSSSPSYFSGYQTVRLNR